MKVVSILFYRRYSGGNRSAEAIVPAVKIRSGGMTQYKEKGYFVRKTLSCSWCKWLGVAAVMLINY